MMRLPILTLVFVLCAGALAAQRAQDPIARFTHPLFSTIDKLVESRKYKDAIALSLSTAEQMRTQADWEGYISFALRAAEIETFEVWKGKGFPGVELYPDYRRPRKYLEDLHRSAGRRIESYPYLKANALFTNAVVYQWLDMPDTAETLHHQALALRRSIYGDASREVADSYLWRGVLYNWGLQRKDLAEENYRKAVGLQKKFLPDSRYALGSVYYGLSHLATEKFHFDQALALANQYLSLYKDIPYEQAFGKQLIANVYWNQGEFEKSLAYRKEAIRIYEQSDFQGDLIMEYSNLSSDLSGLGRYAEAEAALKKGEQIMSSSPVRNQNYAKMLYANFGDLYRTMKNYEAAEAYFAKAMNIATAQYGEKNDEVADVHRMTGQMLLERELFEPALERFQKMLIAVIPDFADANYRAIPDIQDESPYFKNIIAAAFLKGDALLAWYKSTGSIGSLDLALENYRFGYRQIITARKTIGDELSKPFLFSNFKTSIENSIVCARILFQKTGELKFAEDVLYFVELTKYLNVLDALQRAERSNHSEVPADLLYRLKSVRNELAMLQRIHLERGHRHLSPDSVSQLANRILGLIETRQELMLGIARHSGHETADPEDLLVSLSRIRQQLDPDTQILEFFSGSDSIYTISITSRSAAITAVANDAATDSVFSALRTILEGRPSFSRADVADYSRLAYAVYEKIFEPVLERDRIIIIPDGPVNLIPVEALVTGHNETAASFRNLPFLIHAYEVSYAYSSSILFHGANRDRPDIENVLAFSYSDDTGPEGGERQDRMASLPGAYRELTALTGYFNDVTSFSAAGASRKNFFDHAQKNDLIHLAVHGIGDPEVADNSRLVFRGDSLNSGDLYAFDIYNLDLDARLVVLSACETGLGKRQTGEGVFSIARAFTYAGCPSVVMSMWRVGDIFAADIMDGFYKALSRGDAISAALRSSKLEFLKHADGLTAHPSNWASLVLNGRDQSFTKRSTPAAIWLLLMALGVVMCYLAVVKRKRVWNKR